jgi:glycosyltransferase involved in cell wall biosynthesis
MKMSNKAFKMSKALGSDELDAIPCTLPKCLHFYYIGNCRISSESMDGGTRIFIETAKRWINKGHTINLLTTRENYEVCLRSGLSKMNINLISSNKSVRNLYLNYMLRMIRASFWALTTKILSGEHVVIYSGSDFWPNSIPAWLLKMRFRRAKWLATFYLFAPSPLRKESPYRGARRLRGLLYYLSQVPVYGLIRKYADMVWVTSEPDRWRFIGRRLSFEKVIAAQGGVDMKAPALIPEPVNKKFDAVFIGRFHPQKGVLELVDIWRSVCEKRKSAKLALIGVGDLEEQLRKKINRYGLENNIALFGFKDGLEKFKILKDSRVVVHPATYDSGGMAACEAMSCGLPGVSFDLPALKTYYPKGMIKTPCFDFNAFAENILKLLTDSAFYECTARDAFDLARDWDWDRQAEKLLGFLK